MKNIISKGMKVFGAAAMLGVAACAYQEADTEGYETIKASTLTIQFNSMDDVYDVHYQEPVANLLQCVERASEQIVAVAEMGLYREFECLDEDGDAIIKGMASVNNEGEVTNVTRGNGERFVLRAEQVLQNGTP